MAGPFDLAVRLGPVVVSPHFFLESLAYAWASPSTAAKGDAPGTFWRRRTAVPSSWPRLSARRSAASCWAGWKIRPICCGTGAIPSGCSGGKTIVGGLLGATAAVEWTKSRLGIHQRTGDLFAIPICAGIAIGRIGCFLAGLNDHTYGTPTGLPWGVDFGDGIRRHPTQLYEVAFCVALALLLRRLASRPHAEGDLFRVFLFSYMAWRLMIDFLKPEPRLAGLTAIQWCCAGAVVWYARDVGAIMGHRRTVAAHG